MKKVICIFLLLCFMMNVAFADCNWSTGITPLPDGSYKYSSECHLKVGQLVQDNKTKEAQIADLTKALTLKDLAIQKSDERAQLWMDTSSKLEDRLQRIDSLEKKNDWMYFGLGIAAAVGAGWMAAQLIKR